ncbi:MAG TPA: UDP-N-acetylglucosamine 1-carboxyvinyltransferase [bacterium]|nr:UDP-N-acetylglucosamine 1-carboxyvinyltransferase [bacterium]
MEYFDIHGGGPVTGEVTLSGNKNEALPVLAATLLTDEPVVLRNVPDIIDVRIMLEIMERLGVSVDRPEPHRLVICARGVTDSPLDRELCARIRTSFLFVGPLLSRWRRVEVPLPGGDIIGRRRLDTHFLGFTQLGALCEISGEGYRFSSKGLRGAEIHLDEASVTGTENILMAAVCAEGRTVIHNAACEPHVQGLISFLNAMGARIDGAGTNRLTIEGVRSLAGADHTIGPDHIEAGSFIALAAVTGGSLTVKDAAPQHLHTIRRIFQTVGIETRVNGQDIVVPPRQGMSVRKDLHNAVPRIDDGPWPSFPSDLMSIAIVAATRAEGTLLFFEKMFESRLYFVDRLIQMGAQIILCDPHRVVVSGPSVLYGATLESPDIRAGMALLIAAAAAQGRSRIHNIRQIDRGYERIEEKLRKIGITIDRCKLK